MRRNRTTSLRLLVATAAVGGVALVTACEGSNLFGVAGTPTSSVSTDTKAPVVTILEPSGDSVSRALGDSLFVRAQLQDNIGVQSVRMYGIAERGADSLGTFNAVARYEEKDIAFRADLQDTTVVRYLLPTPDSTKEKAYVVVEATDSAGNIGADTLAMQIGGPSVVLLDPQNGQTVNHSFSFRALAVDLQSGVDTVKVHIVGATTNQVLAKGADNQPDSLLFEGDVTLPAGDADSTLQVYATATNGLRVEGRSSQADLTLVSGQVVDTIAPEVTYTVTAGDRVELGDSIRVDVSGQDHMPGSGVMKVGYTVRAISVNRDVSQTLTSDTTFTSAKSGTVRASFTFAPFNVDSLHLPDPINFQITAYMIDGAGNCGASVGGTAPTALPCVTTGGAVTAQGQTPADQRRTVVAGSTVMLPNGGKIMDAVVDPDPMNTHGGAALYLSNIEQNQVEVFDLSSGKFQTPVGVGSEPWGLALNSCAPLTPSPGCGDTLIVANSGGTNLSNVSLATKQEATNRRLLTPDVVLFNVTLSKDDAGLDKYLVTAFPNLPDQFSFSDRPEFVARDSTGRLLYSTKTVKSLDEVGTIRTAEVHDGYKQPAIRLLVGHAAGDKSSSDWRIAHIDNVVGGAGQVQFFDHVPGDLSNIFSEIGVDGSSAAPDSAATLMEADGSDIFIRAGEKWNIDNVGFSDTTYVTASGDGGWVAFGDGAVSPVGRVIMYNAATNTVSGSVPVADLMSNSGEQVEGLGLNYDGTMGVVRGIGQVSFFTTDLRLQGVESLTVTGGAGAVLDPLHADAQSLSNPTGGEYRPDTQLAFIGTSEHTIDIYDTFRFRRIGRVFIRDNIAGPIRAALPFPSDNVDAAGNPLKCKYDDVTDQNGNVIPLGKAVEIYQGGDFNNPWPADGGTSGSEDRCVVVKLYGVTDSGGVVVVNVRKGDILRDHPARQ